MLDYPFIVILPFVRRKKPTFEFETHTQMSEAKNKSSLMNKVTWKFPWGSSFFETTALIFNISQRNADQERVKFPRQPMNQTESSANVLMVLLERKA